MLTNFFSPKKVTVIGASAKPGKVGYSVLKNLLDYGYAGRVYPVNPEASEILGVKVYPRVLDIRGEVDLAVITLPAALVVPVLQECAAKKIKAVIIISAGFKETGHEGALLEQSLVETARKLGIRLLGPNCLGLIDTHSRLNASFAAGMPPAGKIAFFSQSGALCTAILDRALGTGMGFSKFVSLGNEADLRELDLMQFFKQDSKTAVVLGYIEGVRDGRAFLEEARRLTARKPFILLKAGGTAAGARAASSHTGSLAGSEKAYGAAMTQAGIIPASGLDELVDYAQALALQPLPKGPRLAIVTNAGGPGIIAADACERLQMTMASLSARTVKALRVHLPATASLNNPVDVLGDAPAERYANALAVVLKDPGVDGAAVILTPQAMTEPEATAEAVGKIASAQGKPVLASFLGKAKIGPAETVLREFDIPNFQDPQTAIKAFRAMVRYRDRRRWPKEKVRAFAVEKKEAASVIAQAMLKGKRSLEESEARAIISAYGFSVPKTEFAQTSREAGLAAKRIGFPVALKVSSPHILHKTDVGGVRVGLMDEGQVQEAFHAITVSAKRYMPNALIRGAIVQEMVRGGKEVILGMNRDREFGPLLMFGLGGIYVEVLKDVSFRIAPVTKREALEMILEIRSYPLLSGVRGEAPSDIDSLVDALLRFSCLALDFDNILETEINPLLVKPQGQGSTAIDARFALKGFIMKDLPRP